VTVTRDGPEPVRMAGRTIPVSLKLRTGEYPDEPPF